MPILFKLLASIFLVFLVLFLLLFIAILVARIINACNIKIRGANGLEESLYLEIGGIRQYLQIRGENKDNPVILILHGGPANPMSYYSYSWQTRLEDDYTIVHWDQRGCGRTYYANKKRDIEASSTEQLLADLDQVVMYLNQRFTQEKIIILGHSWGSVLGSQYVQRHPEKVQVYIAVGQVIDSIKGDLLSTEEAVRLANNAGEESRAEKISAAYARFRSGSFELRNLMKLRALTAKYLLMGDDISIPEELWMGATSPYLGLVNIRWLLYPIIDVDGFGKINENLYNQLYYSSGFNRYKYPLKFEVPVYFISGGCDWTTPYILVQDYYKAVQAPQKEMILLKNAGHSPFLDKKDDFCQAVKSVLLT